MIWLGLLIFAAALVGAVVGVVLVNAVRERRREKRIMASASRAIRHLTREEDA